MFLQVIRNIINRIVSLRKPVEELQKEVQVEVPTGGREIPE